MKRGKLLLAVVFFALCTYPITVTTAEAGVFDRLKDIYQTPERVEELQSIYAETTQQLEGQLEVQRQQLEQSRSQVEELIQRQEELQRMNDGYRLENEALQAQNEQLLMRMEQMEQDRKSWLRNILLSIGTVVVLFAAYAFSVRIWRYAVWRRQGRDGKEALFP